MGIWNFDPDFFLRANPPLAWISSRDLREVLIQEPMHIVEVKACWGSQCNGKGECCQRQVGVTLKEAIEISHFLLNQSIEPQHAFDLLSDEHLFLARNGESRWCYFFDCIRGGCTIHEQPFRPAWCELSFCQLQRWIENVMEFLDYVRKVVAHPVRVDVFKTMLAEITI